MAKINTKIGSNAGENALASNKWLFLLLALTVIATAWTALQGDSDNANAEIELQPISPKKQSILKLTAPISIVDQGSKIDQTLAPEQAALVTYPSNQTALIPWQQLKREPIKTATHDLFKVHSWLVLPPVKKVKPMPPPPPTAPPVPFIYMGKLDNTPTGTQVFLMANNLLYTTIKGAKINQQWRFDGEEGELLRFTYLPLSLQQTLSKFAKPAIEQPVAVIPETTAVIN